MNEISAGATVWNGCCSWPGVAGCRKWCPHAWAGKHTSAGRFSFYQNFAWIISLGSQHQPMWALTAGPLFSLPSSVPFVCLPLGWGLKRVINVCWDGETSPFTLSDSRSTRIESGKGFLTFCVESGWNWKSTFHKADLFDTFVFLHVWCFMTNKCVRQLLIT